jgi:uncharacterized membrane protein YiaA
LEVNVTAVFELKVENLTLQEMGYYIGAIVLLLIADVVLSAAACSDLLKAGVVSGVSSQSWFEII